MVKIINKIKEAPIQIKSSALFFVALAIQKASTALSLMIFTRLMSTADYGQFSIFNSWLSIWRIVVTLCLSAGIYMQGLVKFEDDRKRFESSMQGFSFFLCVTWLIVFILFRNYINPLFGFSTFQMILALAIIWSNSVFDFWSASERVNFQCVRIFVLALIVALIKPLVCYLTISFSYNKVTGWILGIALTDFVAYSYLFILALNRGRTFFEKSYWLYALSFSIPLIPHYLSQTVLNSADRIMIGKIVGDSEAGIYNLAYSIAMMLTMISKAIVSMLNPWIYRKIKSKRVKDIAGIGYVSLGVVATVNLILISIAPEVIAIVAPSEYYEAIWIITPVAISSYFMFGYDLFSEFAFYYNKTLLIMFASLLGAILNIALNLVCINIWGYLAAGYTTLLCFVIYALVHYLVMNSICKKYIQKEPVYNWKILLSISVVFIVIAFLYMYSYKYNLVRIAISIILIVIVFIISPRLKKYVLSVSRIESSNN